VLPDYFEVIPKPIAFSTIRVSSNPADDCRGLCQLTRRMQNKIQKKLYSNFPEFVRDVAQICHNAQVYNRPSAPIFGAAERLREVFSEKLQQLVAQGKITADEAKIPDLGELPPVEDSPVPDSAIDEQELDEEEDEDDDEEEEEEEEEEDDDSEDDGGRRRRRSSRGRLSSRRDRDIDRDDDAHKKRGRPPMVLTPMEARISSILRGLRKFKGEDGTLLILPFEKLPDKSSNPDYYQTISNPIALDNIKKKAKRKKYNNVDQVMVDIERMFDNAMLYNEDDSQVHKAAFELQGQARILAEQEKARPDDDFRDEDGKLPLAEIEFKGELWKVGKLITHCYGINLVDTRPYAYILRR
jgi:chromatin structure-remodeling complex subunit RSC1/2